MVCFGVCLGISKQRAGSTVASGPVARPWSALGCAREVLRAVDGVWFREDLRGRGPVPSPGRPEPPGPRPQGCGNSTTPNTTQSTTGMPQECAQSTTSPGGCGKLSRPPGLFKARWEFFSLHFWTVINMSPAMPLGAAAVLGSGAAATEL